MDVTLAVLADYANLSREGKLNVMGIFSNINPSKIPFNLPMAYIVTSFEASLAEVNTNKTVRLALIDVEGGELFGVEQELIVPQPPLPGVRPNMTGIMAVNNLRFEKSGDYQLSVLINGEEKRSVPLRVNEPTTGEA